MSDSSYLTRTQIYRALLGTGWNLGTASDPDIQPPNPQLVFKPRSDLGFRRESWTSGQNEITIDSWQAEQDVLTSLGAENNWMERFLGSDLPGQIITAGIGDRKTNPQAPSRRRDWFIRLKTMNDSILQNLAADEFFTFGNPATMSESLAIAAGLATGDYRTGDTLKNAMKEELRRMRNYYTLKDSDDPSAGTRPTKSSLYYDMAYATGNDSRTTYTGHSTSMSSWSLEDFLLLERKAHNRPEPNLFTLNAAAANTPYPNSTTYVGTRILVRIAALHNALYGSEIDPLSYDLFRVRTSGHINTQVWDMIIANIYAAIEVLVADIEELRETAPAKQQAREDAALDALNATLEETGFSLRQPTETEISTFAGNTKYKNYFNTTFQQGVIESVPIIHNLYLTEKYFDGISQAFSAPKIRALDMLIDILREDHDFLTEPNMKRPAAAAAIAAANGDNNFNFEARDFILKMLIETPIEILKGIVELVDPHVAITKLIKTGSAAAFNNGVIALDAGPADTINQMLKEEFGEDTPLRTSGEQLMGLIVCLVEAGFTAGENGLWAAIDSQGLPEPPANFFPTATLDGGIDFTGTVSGMIMAPPLPLGLLYLLLELIRNKLNETQNVDQPTTDPGCDPEEGD
jgi:hypothetical protein